MEWLRSMRFWETEKRIFDVYFDLRHKDVNITPGNLAKIVGISRVTLYRHHFSISRIKQDYEKMLFREYKKFMGRVRDTLPADRLLYKMLLFILKYKKACKLLLEDGNEKLMRDMLTHIRPGIATTYSFAKMPTIIFKIYTSEIYALITDWGEREFTEGELAIVHHDMVYLTRTVPKRLGTLQSR